VAISIRPYAFYVTIGSTLIWLGFYYLTRIKSHFLRTIAFPVFILVGWTVGAVILLQTGSAVGSRYQSIDTMLETAVIIQDDLSKEYYGGNSFDIGDFEPTIPGILSKFPAAITAGIFRPFLWESNNALMFFSGLESIILLLLLAFSLFKNGLVGFVRKIYRNPFFISILVFVITFAFFVGLTTANFGALVRYRSPVLPFTVLILLISLPSKQSNKSNTIS